MKLYILVGLLFACGCSTSYSMIGQPFNYTPARTPYWYRSQARNQEQARIKKYWKRRQQEEANMNQEMQMQRQYESNMPMPENPEYLPD